MTASGSSRRTVEARTGSDERVREMLASAYCGRLATVGPAGWPYVVPLLYVWMDDEIWVHNTGARGHLRENVEREPRVCFEVDDPGPVFPYGRFECDSTLAYRSVVGFGRIRIVEGRVAKTAFCHALMAKYADPRWERPKDFFPRLDQITVYAVAVERMTGEELALPGPEDRWPAVDRARTPHAAP